MRNEIPKLGWIRANFRFEQSRRGLKGLLTRKGVLTAQCGRNLNAGPDDPTNRCLRLDESGLTARIHALGVKGVITPQQAQDWIESLPALDDHILRGSCLGSSNIDRSHVYDYFHNVRRRCGGVMVTEHPL